MSPYCFSSKKLISLSAVVPFNLIFFFLFGEHYKLGFKNLRISNCKIISDEEVAYNVDGEYAFKKKEVNIEVYKQAIDIIINKKIAKKYF